MNRALRLLAAAVAGFVPGLAGAHEFWIEPSTFTPASDAALRITLRHGERFLGDAVERRDDLIERFTVAGPDGETPVVGRSGATANYARATAPGVHVIGYHSRRMTNHLDADAFEAYLQEEGLGRVIDMRAERGESDRPGREVYSRCAKALIAVDGATTGADRMLGLPLEIMLETSPTDLGSGAPLVARVLFRGKPLAGATVVAVSAETPGELLRINTDRDGRVQLTLPAPGPWMLTTIQMVPAPQGVDADWESFWASLTFAR